jgi:PAS domain S-box-containing protein
LEQSDALVQIAGRVARMGGWLFAAIEATRVYWSDEVAAIHDMPPGTHPSIEDAIGYYAPEWRDRISEVFGRCVAEGVPFDEEMEIITARGRRVWVRAIGEAVRNSSGTVTHVQGAFQDISEQKRAEAEMRVVENRLATTLESISDGFMTLDLDWRITYVNGELERMTGRDRSSLLGRNLWEEFPGTSEQRFGMYYRRAVAENRSVTFEDFRPSAGIWVEVHAHPTGEGLAVYIRDVTERHHAEKQLRQQEEQYRAIVEAVNDAILILDGESRVITANDAACVMHGYTRDALIGLHFSELVHSADREKVEQIVTAARQGEAAYTEAVHVKRDRAEVQVVVNSTSFRLAGAPHVLLVVSNVSEQKRLQQQLERSDRISSLGRLAANIAHEMNNVMMGILPFTEVIRRRTTADPLLQTAAAHIVKSVERGKIVTQEILRFTRAASDPELKPLDGARLLEDVADELRSSLPPSVVLEVTCEKGLHVLGDAGQLHQVLTNLIVNARDALRSGGHIRLRMATCSDFAATYFAGIVDPRNYVQLEISDEGVGIPAAVLGQIFEPLFTTKGSGGTGLGLAIVHQIVTQHGGQVRAESTPGAGTVFHVLLRRAPPSEVAAETVEQAPHVSPWRDIRDVMLVEDEPLVAEGIAALLAAEGVACERIGLGRAAIDRLLAHRPDLLILDVGLPDISGIDVYRAIAETQKNLPTIFSTGHGDHRLLAELGAPATVRFISKPYDFDELSKQVAQLRERR